MEEGLGVKEISGEDTQTVLILVLMEEGLGEEIECYNVNANRS